YDADKPLETGMVVSVETTLQHPKRGFIKLEDTVVVTDKGFEIYGEGGRGWNRGGTALARWLRAHEGTDRRRRNWRSNNRAQLARRRHRVLRLRIRCLPAGARGWDQSAAQ